MRKIGIILCFVLSIYTFSMYSCRNQDNKVGVQIKKLDYPSASTIEFHNGKLYVIGDDATKLLVLDTDLSIIDSIPLFSYGDNRIPKNIKPDLEAIAIYGDSLFLFGSGSLSPYRNRGWIFNLRTQNNDSIDLEPVYLKLKEHGIEQINIEGACFVARKLLLVNRGNKGYPYNYLVVTDEKFWTNADSIRISVIPFSLQKDTSSFMGISGLCHAKKNDQLIMTVSTEDTRNVYDDGAIGKSYLWIINNISSKLNSEMAVPDRVIDLETIDPHFKSQKIESVTVIKETGETLEIVLVADNDDGSSTIFKLNLPKR